MTSCDLFKKDTDYIINNTAPVSMVFVVPAANAVKPTPGTTQQISYDQPNYNVIRGTFSVSGSTDITVQFSGSNVTSLAVNAFRTGKNATSGLTEIQREPRSTFTTFTDNQAKVVLPLNTLNFGNNAVLAGREKELVLEFVATGADGKTVVRYFTVTGS